MRFRGWLSVSGIALLAALLAAPASAKVGVYDEDSRLSQIEKARCAVKGKKGHKHFVAFADGTNGWELDVYAFEGPWRGVGREYPLRFGDRKLGFDLFAPDGTLFSNQFPFPGTPPGSGGALTFSDDGRRLGVGFFSAPNRDYSDGVAIAGVLKCKYKRKHRP